MTRAKLVASSALKARQTTLAATSMLTSKERIRPAAGPSVVEAEARSTSAGEVRAERTAGRRPMTRPVTSVMPAVSDSIRPSSVTSSSRGRAIGA